MSVDAEPLSDRKLCLSVQNSGFAKVGLLAGHNLGLKCLHTQLSRNVYMMLKQVKNLDKLADLVRGTKCLLGKKYFLMFSVTRCSCRSTHHHDALEVCPSVISVIFLFPIL